MAAHTPDGDAGTQKLPSLGIKCTDSRCEEQLHCFRPTSAMTREQRGNCRSCDADLVEWARVHQRDPGDVDYLVNVLDIELVRHHMWRVRVPDRVRELAINPRQYSLDEMLMRSLRRSLARPRSQNPWDGRQTPWPNKEYARIYHYGQHATATCCRQCLEYWHGLAAEIPVGEREFDYLAVLVRRYIDERMSE